MKRFRNLKQSLPLAFCTACAAVLPTSNITAQNPQPENKNTPPVHVINFASYTVPKYVQVERARAEAAIQAEIDRGNKDVVLVSFGKTSFGPGVLFDTMVLPLKRLDHLPDVMHNINVFAGAFCSGQSNRATRMELTEANIPKERAEKLALPEHFYAVMSIDCADIYKNCTFGPHYMPDRLCDIGRFEP